MSMLLKNMILSIFMLAIGSGYLYLSLQLPDRSIQNVPGPAFFPTIISGFIIFLAIALLIKSLVEIRDKPFFEHELMFPKRAVLTLIWFFLFLVVMPYAGFIAAGMPFFAGLMLLCGRRKPLNIIIGSVVIPICLYFLFRDVFQILLPAGQWI